MGTIIETKELCKVYSGHRAIDQLSFTVEQGDIFGFVGPNGAGKTSTIRILSTLLKPSGGEAWIGGYSVTKAQKDIRRIIGYMPDFFGIYDDLSVGEYLTFFAGCYKIPTERHVRLIDEALELVELAHRKNDPVNTLSTGLKQRLSLARILLHDPQVLILDEPAAGLDPRARVEIRSLLVELARLGKTIFFSTHVLSDVAEICTRVAIIEAGKLVAVGSARELQEQLLPHRQLVVRTISDVEKLEAYLSGYTKVISVMRQEIRDGKLSEVLVEFTGNISEVSQLLTSLIEAGFELVSFSEVENDLEEVFLRATKGLVT